MVLKNRSWIGYIGQIKSDQFVTHYKIVFFNTSLGSSWYSDAMLTKVT